MNAWLYNCGRRVKLVSKSYQLKKRVVLSIQQKLEVTSRCCWAASSRATAPLTRDTSALLSTSPDEPVRSPFTDAAL